MPSGWKANSILLRYPNGSGAARIGRMGKSWKPPSRSRLSRTAAALASSCAEYATCCQEQPPQPCAKCGQRGSTRSADGFSTAMTSASAWRRCVFRTLGAHQLAGCRAGYEDGETIQAANARSAVRQPIDLDRDFIARTKVRAACWGGCQKRILCRRQCATVLMETLRGFPNLPALWLRQSKARLRQRG
jgi:hypothetical protein